VRVGIVCGSCPPMPCGIGDYTAHLAEALSQLGHEVTVVTSVGAQPPANGSWRVYPQVERWNWHALPTILRILRDARVQAASIQYPTQQYGRDPMVNALPALIQARLGVPVTATIHEFSTFRLLGRLRLALTARLSRAVITTDGANQALLARWTGRAASELALVPLASNLPCAPPEGYQRAALRAHLGAGPTSVVLAYLGFISPSKGLEDLLDAFALALAEAPELDLRLWLVASREPAAPRYAAYHAEIERRLERLNGRERVVWTGYLEAAQVSAHLLAADVAVLPFRDGASLRRGTLLAALAHGLPVVSTLGPGAAADGLGESQGLCLVPARDGQALARTVVGLARDGALRRDLAGRAAAFGARFSWPAVAEQTLAILESTREATHGG